jgi:hypothetical protein
MADALKRLHKPVDLLDLKSEDHWLSHTETRVQMVGEVAMFLKTHNPRCRFRALMHAQSQSSRPVSGVAGGTCGWFCGARILHRAQVGLRDRAQE